MQTVDWKKKLWCNAKCSYLFFWIFRWFHYVDSKPGRNMAVNFWFHHLPWFNSSDCEGVDPYQNSSVPLSSVKTPDPDSETRFCSTWHYFYKHTNFKITCRSQCFVLIDLFTKIEFSFRLGLTPTGTSFQLLYMFPTIFKA